MQGIFGKIILPVLIAVITTATLAGQIIKPYNPIGPMGEIGKENLPGQKVGANDLVAVSVYDAPELTRTVRVSSEGYLRLPMLKKRLRAEGLLPSELETVISDALKDEGILVEPVVVVTIAEYSSRPVSVIGAVRKPLTFQASGNMTLLQAIGQAEGLTAEAGPEIIVSRANKEDPAHPLLQRIDVRELIDNARPDLNLPLVGGEEIRIPEARKIYVAGNVKKPGAIPVREGSPVTILKAIGLSEGLTPYYKKTVYILRPDSTGNKQEIPVELSQILDRKSEDLALQAEDILYVPDDPRKRLTMNVIEKAATFSLGTISGFLIWRGR